MPILNLLAIEHLDEEDQPEAAKLREVAAAASRAIDREHASALYPVINSLPRGSETRSKLGELAEWLDPEMRELYEGIPDCRQSYASAGYLTDKAFRIGAAAEALVAPDRADFFVTSISSRRWRFSPEELDDLSMVEFVDEFTGAFKFLGVDGAHGSLLAFVHGSFDPLHREFELSVFGLADRVMSQSIERLRGFPTFCDRDNAGELITVTPLSDYTQPLRTLVQSNWPVKIRYLDAGKRQSIEFEGPIGHPYFAPSMLWRDRWDLSQAAVMIGLYVDGNKLVPFHR